MNDTVNHPAHYTSGGIEDLKKARVYLDWLIQSVDTKESEDDNEWE